jgi:glycolate oxidase iron-sulfur subunit
MSEIETLKTIDYSVLQQCMHCGMCLPTCPTYDETLQERNSPRGRISLMRAIADGNLEATRAFGDEMYYCLGCLACETACPAGVNYSHLFEVARAEVERSHVLDNPTRSAIRGVVLRGLFTRPRLLHLVGRLLWLYRASGAQWIFRTLQLNKILSKRYQALEGQTPNACAQFSSDLIRPVEKPSTVPKYRVAVLTGCVQDVLFSDINRDTVDALIANGCEVYTPPLQPCCGSLHAHNGDMHTASELARRQLDLFDVENLDAILTNAAGCGSHLRTYGRLLADDPVYSKRAAIWSAKLKDIHEWLVQIGVRPPRSQPIHEKVAYHEACHLCHGQKITKQPREVLRAVPGLELVELPESTWCCGSAGIYNITQPEMAAKLQERKLRNIITTGVDVVATANPGCHLQLVNGALKAGKNLQIIHPISLLAQAYRRENG